MEQFFSLEKFLVINNSNKIFDIKFVESNSARSKLLTTVIIGANGAGKSYLLALISDLFRTLENKIKNKEVNLRYEYYLLNYYIDNDFYSVEISNKKNFIIKRNNKKINIDQLKLPTKILAVSYMVNDKFTFKPPYSIEEDMYEYLGIRRTSNAAWTNSITRKISDAFIEISSNTNFNYKVFEILKFLRLDPKITLIFEPVGKTLFNKTPSVKQITTKIKNLSNTDEYRSTKVKKYFNEILDLQNFLKSFSKNKLSSERNLLLMKDRNNLVYNLDFNDISMHNYLTKDNKFLSMLIDLQMINSPKLILYKDNSKFDFELASSGEKHIIFTLINIASKIKQNSLILIDEPELSLHPNWQMRYINTLKKVFYEYESCHFILATHSHYIISDLEKESSSVIIINTENEEHIRTSELIKYSTFAPQLCE